MTLSEDRALLARINQAIRATRDAGQEPSEHLLAIRDDLRRRVRRATDLRNIPDADNEFVRHLAAR